MDGLGVVDEHVEAGGVDQVDLLLVPLGCGDGGGDRDLASDLLLVKIGDGGAVFGAGQAVGGAGRKQEPRRKRSLAGIAVTDQGHVPNIAGFVNFH